MSLPEYRLLYLRSDAFEHVFAGYTATGDALISMENMEKYVACVCAVWLGVVRNRSVLNFVVGLAKTSAFIFP
jgi:hypothetical protein